MLDAARERRKAMLSEADELLAGLDGIVLQQLGLTLPPPDDRMIYAVRLGDGFRQRFDANFHTPQFRKIDRMLERHGAERLGTIATLSEERADPRRSGETHFRYIEIGSVSAESGEASAVETPSGEAPSRARMVVHDGDIIVSLTRPHRGSIAVIDESLDGAIASTGFAVVTDFEQHGVDVSYFWAYLRTLLARLQMLQRSSGGNYPAITEDELRNILVPVPSPKIQQTIAAEVARRRAEARRLRAEADRLWEQAKADFEEALLGPNAASIPGKE